jgi:DNA-binding NarL/FixJ family response regulator
MRLLLCDGHVVFAESLALLLAEAGYTVVAVAHSFDETLSALRREHVDACVLDESCRPLDVLDSLADQPASGRRPNLILLSSVADAELTTAARTRGVSSFASKDRHVTDLLQTIERLRSAGPGQPRSAAGSAPRQPTPSLTPREREVLRWLVRGADTEAVARTLGVTKATARTHIRSVLRKLGAHSRIEAAAVAIRHSLVDAETGEWTER